MYLQNELTYSTHSTTAIDMRNQIVNPCCDIAAPMLEKEDDEVKKRVRLYFQCNGGDYE